MGSESDTVISYCFVEELASLASCTSRISRSIPGQVRRTFGPSVDPRAAKSALIAGVSVLSLLGARASQGISASFCVQQLVHLQFRTYASHSHISLRQPLKNWSELITRCLPGNSSFVADNRRLITTVGVPPGYATSSPLFRTGLAPAGSSLPIYPSSLRVRRVITFWYQV